MSSLRTASTAREVQEAPAVVYTRDSLNFKAKTWTWSAPGPMASVQHAERKEVVAAAPEFDEEVFEVTWWAGESWDWE